MTDKIETADMDSDRTESQPQSLMLDVPDSNQKKKIHEQLWIVVTTMSFYSTFIRQTPTPQKDYSKI